MEDKHRYSKASLLFSEIAHNCRAQATRYEALAKLFGLANQPLSEPQKAPLAGNIPAELSSVEKTVLDSIAELGSVCAETLEMSLALPWRALAPAVDLLVRRRLIETFADERGIVWYRLPVENAPASGKHPIGAPWIPDELPDSGEMTCPRDPRCTLGPFHNEPCNAPADASPQSEALPITAPATPPAIESVEEPDGKMTAREWRNLKHFLIFMRQPEFKQWNAEEQNARGDQFVAHVESTTPEKRMGKWGQQFKIFHNLKEKK